MNRDNWMSICTSFKDLFEFVGNNHDELSSLSRFTINDVTELNQLIIAQKNHNGWFTEEIVRKALLGLSQMMNPIDLINWQNNYTFTENPKRVLLIMAGNIPLVGFHDLLCVWLSGNHAQIKLSSDDKTLLPAILDLVSEIHPEIKSYDFFEAILPYYEIVNHKKYGNNYDYNRAILLLNQETFLDNNFVIVKESDKLFSPISMIHFSRYKDNSEISEFIQKNEDNIQIILGKNYIPFGQGQYPKIWDYADGTDTMTWLNSLS
jgi:hypothetical protein